MRIQLVKSTVGRVQEMGLLPQTQIAKGQQPTELQKNLPQGNEAGEQLLPPKPSTVVEVPDSLRNMQISDQTGRQPVGRRGPAGMGEHEPTAKEGLSCQLEPLEQGADKYPTNLSRA
jgi:hypothetical protein